MSNSESVNFVIWRYRFYRSVYINFFTNIFERRKNTCHARNELKLNTYTQYRTAYSLRHCHFSAFRFSLGSTGVSIFLSLEINLAVVAWSETRYSVLRKGES